MTDGGSKDVSHQSVQVTCTGPVNIAVIKYWGKRNEDLILPINGSISCTLSQVHLRAKTSIMASPKFDEDKMWLNGIPQSMNNPRLQHVLKEMRRRCRKRKLSDTDFVPDWKLHICSENNFPTAAGLASSAAGYACLVYCLSKVLDVPGDISSVARQGSGSACRSIYGGFVEWQMGTDPSGCDSIACQLAPEDHWEDLRVIILVVSSKKKIVGSTSGMQTSVETSELLKYRAQSTVPKRLNEMKTAIKQKDFNAFAELTMKDSNEMHACCLDSYPSISYMQDTSRDIQRLVHAINKFHKCNKVCYTFDAGPNSCLYLLEKDVPMVTAVVKHFFPPVENGGEFVKGIDISDCTVDKDLLSSVPLVQSPGGIQYIISTKLGPGPQVLNSDESLLDKDGSPISTRIC